MNAISNHSTPDERPSRRSACRTLGMLAHNGQMGIAASADALIDQKSFASKHRPSRHRLISTEHRRVRLDAHHLPEEVDPEEDQGKERHECDEHSQGRIICCKPLGIITERPIRIVISRDG